jgi:hypothetical protein
MTSTQNTPQVNTPSGKEMGLIKHLSCRNRQLKWSQDDLEESQNVAKTMLYEFGGADAVFDYHHRLGHMEKAYEPTIIDDYTNKKGHTTKAHFTINGRYYGAVRTHGTKPIMVLQYVAIHPDDCKERWEVSPTAPHKLIAIKK